MKIKISEAMIKGLVIANKNGVKQSNNSRIIPYDFARTKNCCVLGLALLGKYGFKRVCAMAEKRLKNPRMDTFYSLIFKNFPTVNSDNVGDIYAFNDTLELPFERCIEEVEALELEGKF